MKSAHKNLFQTSDFIAYGFMAIAFLIELFISTTFVSAYFNRNEIFVTGIIILLMAWTIILNAKIQFKHYMQKSAPGKQTTRLVSDGIFKYSRNPMYLGVLFLVPSFAFILDSIWILITIAPIYFSLRRFLIIPEEKYLLELFGDEYKKYCEKVRRWI